jgi:hypothetical protein
MTRNTTPENTSDRGALTHVVGMLGGSERYITDMESAGQRQILAATTLPTKSDYCSDEDYIALGFTFGPVVASDPKFREATLPAGWSREGSEHAMWSYIVDERGVRRVSIFYKAAFYDREAFMGVINVGGDVARHWIYGDDEPELHPALTTDELAAARRSAEHYLEEAERYPHREDRVPRARSLIEAVDAALATTPKADQ